LLLAVAGAVACGAAPSTPTGHPDTPTAKKIAGPCGDIPTDGAATEAPTDLGCTGLYADLGIKKLTDGVRRFAPAYQVWADSASQSRFILLPPGSIDNSDPDDWILPVGTKAWKEISLEGKQLETRFLWKVAEGTWVKAVYVWTPDGKTATRNDDGVKDAVNDATTQYDIPAAKECDKCHAGKTDRLLGFEAVNLGLPGALGITYDRLALESRFTVPPKRTRFAITAPSEQGPATPGHQAPGNSLGYLHVNCGVSCHGDRGGGGGDATGLDLHMKTSIFDLAEYPSVWAFPAVQTTVGIESTSTKYTKESRIVPGFGKDGGLIITLMSRRDDGQMPPLGTRMPDMRGEKILTTWISSLRVNPDLVGVIDERPPVPVP
jgi:hypothetical protein